MAKTATNSEPGIGKGRNCQATGLDKAMSRYPRSWKTYPKEYIAFQQIGNVSIVFLLSEIYVRPDKSSIRPCDKDNGAINCNIFHSRKITIKTMTFPCVVCITPFVHLY